MSKWEKALNQVMEEAKKDGDWEDGDECAYVCKDAVVIISLENRELKVKVLAGEPVYLLEVEFDLLEKDGE